MNGLESSRHTEQALEWAAATIGGRIVRSVRERRWRPVYYLDIERPDGTLKKVMLRGFRNPVSGDETAWRERLRIEAGICDVLGRAGCKVAAFHGYEPKGGWFLMDVLEGTPYISRVDDEERRTKLYRQYIEAIAQVHLLDYEQLDLPDGLPIAKDYEESIGLMLGEYRLGYERYPAKGPEPLIELALWWLDNHRPKPAKRFALTTGDIGSDQFMFSGDTVTGFFDLEMAYVGDPLQDIGLARLRDMGYHVPGLPEYFQYWSELTDRELDKDSVCWWTVAAMIGTPVYAYPTWHQPIAQLHQDTTFVHAIVPVHLRGTCEALAEFYDFELEPPDEPPARINSYTKYNQWLSGQLSEYYPTKTDDDVLLHDYRASAALAESAVLCQTLGPTLEQQNLDDVEKLLGERFDGELDALQALTERIKTSPSTDLEDTIRTLYRIQCRKEFVVEPIQRFCGFGGHRKPMQRFF